MPFEIPVPEPASCVPRADAGKKFGAVVEGDDKPAAAVVRCWPGGNRMSDLFGAEETKRMRCLVRRRELLKTRHWC